MTKETSPPANKSNPSPLLDAETAPAESIIDKLGKYYTSLPVVDRSQFLAAIGSDEFMEAFSAYASSKRSPPEVKFESEDDGFDAFADSEAANAKEEYERYKRHYNATTLFGKANVPAQTFSSGFQVNSNPRLGDQSLSKVILYKGDRGDTPLARQKTREKVVRALKPDIRACNVSKILTSNDENNYDVAADVLSTQTIFQGLKRYITQYDFTSIILIPQGMSSRFTPQDITSSTVWLHAIDDFVRLEDHHYSAWQEFILRHGTPVEIESDEWLEGTLLLSMEGTLRAEVESDLKGLPPTQVGALTMLRFIIKRLVIRNQEAWDALEEYVRTFDIRNFPGENVPTACLKLKAVLGVLGNKTPSNAVRTILEGFAHASTATFRDVCRSKIAMRSDSIYATLLASVPLSTQLSSMLDDLEQNYQQLMSAKKWEGVGHLATSKSAFNASPDDDDTATSYVAYLKNKGAKKILHFDDWAKLQVCHFCGKKGHVTPQCRQYLAAKANGTLPVGTKKKSNVPTPASPLVRRDKLMRDPKLKALISAFSAFTTDYLVDETVVPMPDTPVTNNDDADDDMGVDQDDVNAFLGMVGALKE
jgi:hypothetical protein